MRVSLLAVLALSACARPAVAPPAVEVRVVEKVVPVAVSCVKAADIPSEPAKIGAKLTGDARRDLDTVSASALRLRTWGVKLAAMLRGCAG